MQVSKSDLIGQEVLWSDDSDDPHQATIERFISSGVTADVYAAVDKRYVRPVAVKILKQSENHNRYERELTVLSEIRETQGHAGFMLNVPEAHEGTIEGVDTPIVVMEYFSPDDRWLSHTIGQEIIFKGALQLIDLYQTCQDLGYANLDVKIENFYWIEEESRLVLLDWNRCVSNEVIRDDERFWDYLSDSFSAVLNVVYEMLTGVAPVNPLPALDAEEPEAWEAAPSVIKRTMYEVRQLDEIDFEELRSRFIWYISARRYYNDGDWDLLLGLMDSIEQNTEVSEMETRDILEDILSMIDWEQVPENYASYFEVFEEQEQFPLDDPAWEVQKVFDQVFDQIPAHPTQAMTMCENAVDELDVPRTALWKLGRIYAVAVLVRDLFEKHGMYSEEEAESIVQFFDGEPVEMILGANQGRDDLVLALNEKFQLAEQLIEDGDEIVEEYSPEDQLEALDDLEDRITLLKEYLPELTYNTLRYRLPIWDRKRLEADVSSRGTYERLMADSSAFKKELIDLLEEEQFYPFEDIQTLITEADFELQSDHELRILLEVQEEAQTAQWARAIYEIIDMPKPSGLMQLVKESLLRSAQGWLNSLSGTLYMPEIRRISELINLFEEEAPDLFIEPEIRDRVSCAEQGVIDDVNSLQACQALDIEPWAQSASDRSVLIDNLLRVAILKQQQAAIMRIRSDIEEVEQFQWVVSEEEQQQLSMRIEELTKKLTIHKNQVDLQKNFQLQYEQLIEVVSKADQIQSELDEKIATIERLTRELTSRQAVIEPVLPKIGQAEKIVAQLIQTQESEQLILTVLIDFLGKGDFPSARDYLLQVIASQEQISGQPPGQLTLLRQWLFHLNDILKEESLQSAYADWFSALATDDLEESNRIMQQLVVDSFRPLYVYLAAQHDRLIAVPAFLPVANVWWEKFMKGDLLTLKSQITLYAQSIQAGDSPYRMALIREWEQRCDLALNMARLIKKDDFKKFKKWLSDPEKLMGLLVSDTVLNAAQAYAQTLEEDFEE
jgi:hypothetical protein